MDTEETWRDTLLHETAIISSRVFSEVLTPNRLIPKAHYVYSDGYTDDAEYTLFECCRWKSERYTLQEQLGIDKLSPNNLTNIRISNFQEWSYIADYSERILRQKKMDHNTETQ